MDFRKLNNIAGWITFAIATLVYLITVEEVASYWDAGEFIAVSYRLMVPHPPGAPFYLLIGRIFSLLSFGDTEQVGYWINIVSVLSSGFTILFLFWTISMLARKILGVVPGVRPTGFQTVAILGASAVGALAYTFSDSFWFSAVEAEVYAMSSFFTAIVVWAMLKWDLIEDESRANRWLILIAYMMGLSIGVHLLNLVTIPALGLIYYFKKYTVSVKGIVWTMLISGFIVILINNLIIPGLPSLAGVFEIYFVNGIGLPFGSGAIFIALIIIGAVVWGVRKTQNDKRPLLNTALLSLAFILIGYSSYSIIVIRSNYDPPIDENNPENVITFVKYLKREQYGSRPLLYGKYYTADLVRDEVGNPVTEEGEKLYAKGEEEYEVVDTRVEYKYDPRESTILPRMYSEAPAHVQRYRQVTGLRPNESPSFADNMYYMFAHQLGTMYFRYFMWNFTGRESDVQNAGVLYPLEALTEEVPDEIAQNKGRNNYFMIPFFLGIVGLFFQARKDLHGFAFVAMLFFLTGIALILYLNSPPIEPRERDYIYVGSFYAFAIWIGFSVLAIADGLRKMLPGKNASIAATILCLVAPGIMAQQNWDDHDRSNRYFSVDSAKNFLTSTAENAILFTGGDNDTFPLWYVQDVEGFRTDARVVVLSYFNTDWYIEQMMRPVYESDPFPFTLTLKNYQSGGPNDYLPLYDNFGLRSIDLRQYINLLKQNDERLRVNPSTNVLPSGTLTLPIDKEKVRSLGIIPEGMDSLLVDRMTINLKRGQRGIEKKDLAILDILATTDWSRPIYLNNTSREQINIDLEPYLVQEGNAYRILPIRNPRPEIDMVDTETMFTNLMENFYYRELDNPEVYYTEDYRKFVLNHRSTFNTLAASLISEGKMDKAREALLFMLEKMPDEAIPYDYTSSRTVALLYMLEENDLARSIAETVGNRAIEMINYIQATNNDTGFVLQENIIVLNELQRTMLMNGEEELAEKFTNAYNEGMQLYENYRRM